MNTSTVIEAAAARLTFPEVAWFGRVDAEGLLEAPPSQWGDDYGVAAPHPFHPAEIEVALGDRGPYRSRDVWTSLGPIEAESAKVSAGRTQCGKLDPELGEKTRPCCRHLSGFVVEHDIFAGDESIGEINAEAAGEVVVANSGRTQRPCLTGERAVSRSLLEGDSDDPVHHICQYDVAVEAHRAQEDEASPPRSASRDGCWRFEA
jgi:hypothetical protein